MCDVASWVQYFGCGFGLIVLHCFRKKVALLIVPLLRTGTSSVFVLFLA